MILRGGGASWGEREEFYNFFCADVHRKNLYVVKQKCTVTNCSYLF